MSLLSHKANMQDFRDLLFNLFTGITASAFIGAGLWWVMINLI